MWFCVKWEKHFPDAVVAIAVEKNVRRPSLNLTTCNILLTYLEACAKSPATSSH